MTEFDDEMAVLKSQREALREQIRPLHESLTKNHEAIEALQAKRTARLRYFETILHNEFSMRHGGYQLETNEAYIKIMLTRDNKLSAEKNGNGIRFFATILTPHSDGYVHFGIFDHTLSEGGVLGLLVKPDLSELVLTFTRWGGTRNIKTFTNVDDAVAYIQKNHWYDKEKDEEE